MTEPLVVGVELGGTKTVAVLGRGREIFARAQWPTEDPSTTLRHAAHQIAAWASDHQPQALGIATFGPVGLHPGTPEFGRMLATPKPGWAGADVAGVLGAGLPGPLAIHTDVTAAALAEGAWGAARGCRSWIHVTVGTGIGFGIVVDGRPLTGRMHPEAGHLAVLRLPGDDWPGICPYHGACLEGLASGPAIAARAGRPASELAPGDPLWEPVAHALAHGLYAAALTVSPERIILGGGVALGAGAHLLPLIEEQMIALDRGYLGFSAGFVQPAALGADAGPLGALLVGAQAASV
jgi:fructokinase